MKKLLFSAILITILASLLLLSACGRDDTPPSETDTSLLPGESLSPGDTTKDTQEPGTGSLLEDVTAIPRYDYFEADVSKDVTVEPSDYTDLHLTLPATLLITDQDVQLYIQQKLLFERRTADDNLKKVTDKPLKLGDSAFIYYRGTVDGVEFEGGSNMSSEAPVELGLGSGTFIPGFEDGLVGVIPSQTSKEHPFALHVTFPEDYGNEQLNGKEAVFEVIVEYAIQYTIPTYDRNFVEKTLQYEPQKDFYASDKALLTEFEAYVKTFLEEQNKQNILYAQTNALWTHLTSEITCRNLPESELRFYYDSYVSEIEYYYEMYKSYDASFATMYPDVDSFAVVYMGLSKGADWKVELTHMSEMLVKKDMISHAIAEAEGMETVSEEEYKAQVAYWVSQYQGYMTEAEIIKSMGELYLREAAFSEKMGTWLMERVTFLYE